jgi:hypothetical protein
MRHLKAYLVPSRHEAGRNLSFLLTKVEKWISEYLSFLDIDHPRHYTFFIEEGDMITELARESARIGEKRIPGA